MATITAGDFRNGVTFEYDNDVCQVIEFQHVKPGKGAAFVRTKYKKIMTGAIRESRPVQRSRFLCSSSRARRSRSTPARASICPERNSSL